MFVQGPRVGHVKATIAALCLFEGTQSAIHLDGGGCVTKMYLDLDDGDFLSLKDAWVLDIREFGAVLHAWFQ